MSRINDLIKELCPNGVEYKLLKDVSEMKRGQSITTKNLKIGKIPVIAGGQEPSFYNDKYNREGETITVSSSGAYAGFLNYWNEPILCTDSFSIKAKKLNMRYLYHYLKMKQNEIYNKKRGAGIPHVHISDLEKFKIPCPPLEVQGEIVRILDKFGELEAELEAELEVRKSQYEFWREKLLNTGNSNQEYITLGDIGKVCMCKRIMKNETSGSGDVPFYKIGTFGKQADAYISYDIFNDYKKRFSYPKKGEILVSCSGTIGRSVVFDGEDAYFQDSNIVWLSNDESKVLNKFLYYFYQTSPWNISDGGTIKRLYNNQFISAKVPLYSLEEQKKIVDILERFDTLINDISDGLPAEIELRRKQYEYHRNKLLSFEELNYETIA